MLDLSISKAMETLGIKIVAMALGIQLILGYVVGGVLPEFNDVAVAAGIILGTAYIIRKKYMRPEPKSYFMVGLISYAAYVAAIVFFKLTVEPINLAEELISPFIFGGLCIGVFYALRRI